MSETCGFGNPVMPATWSGTGLQYPGSRHLIETRPHPHRPDVVGGDATFDWIDDEELVA